MLMRESTLVGNLMIIPTLNNFFFSCLWLVPSRVLSPVVLLLSQGSSTERIFLTNDFLLLVFDLMTEVFHAGIFDIWKTTSLIITCAICWEAGVVIECVLLVWSDFLFFCGEGDLLTFLVREFKFATSVALVNMALVWTSCLFICALIFKILVW